MKAIPLEGCRWCPFRQDGYDSDNEKDSRCAKVTVRKGNWKLIKFEELAHFEDGKFSHFNKFPDWCPLGDYNE